LSIFIDQTAEYWGDQTITEKIISTVYLPRRIRNSPHSPDLTEDVRPGSAASDQ
jgi:hypothetical protein